MYDTDCDDRDKFYIGQTGRALKERFKEHLPKSNLNTVRSNYAKHLMAFNHNYTDFDNNFIPLYVCNKGRYMNAAEEFEIYKDFKTNQNIVLNDQLDFKSHDLYDRFLGAVNISKATSQVDKMT